MSKVAKAIISGLGTGYLRPAPGTWGSAAACAVFLAAAYFSAGDAVVVAAVLAGVLLASSAGCVAFGGQAEQFYKKKDPSYCTIDEWAGQSLTLLALPLGTGWRDFLLVAAVGFVLFRIFDIVKPPPARQLEKLPLGWGVLLDDIFAGIYANIIAQVILRSGFHLS